MIARAGGWVSTLKSMAVSKMLKSGGVVTHMQLIKDNIQYLVGTGSMSFSYCPLAPYDATACDFLDSLSRKLMADVQAKQYPDFITFAFWCRKANIKKLKKESDQSYLRLGVGICFHITPSNVPINFAYSFAFALLAGNANIVRVPSKDYPQTEIVCRLINNLFKKEKYSKIA